MEKYDDIINTMSEQELYYKKALEERDECRKKLEEIEKEELERAKKMAKNHFE